MRLGEWIEGRRPNDGEEGRGGQANSGKGIRQLNNGQITIP